MAFGPTEDPTPDVPPEDTAAEEGVEERDDKRVFPFELSKLIKDFHQQRNAHRVFAINSRDGSILSGFDPAFRFGIQLEAGRAVNNGAHTRVQGDPAMAARLLANLNAKADHAIVDLSDQEDSAPLLLALDVLRDGLEREAEEGHASYGSYNNILTSFVVHPEREDQVLKHPAFGKRVFAVVRVTDAGVTLIFTATNLNPGFKPASKDVTVDIAELLPKWVHEALAERTIGTYYCLTQSQDANQLKAQYFAVHREIGRRTLGKDLPPHERFDVSLIGRTLNVIPSDYAKQMIAHHGKTRITAAHGKSLTWLPKNLAAWEQMVDLERLSALEIDPEAKPAILDVVADAIQIRTPNYQLPPAMRLGYLIGRSSILCTKTTEGYERGRLYPIRYRPDVQKEKKYHAPEPDKYGVEVEVLHERRLKAMELTIGHRTFFDTEASDIAFIVDHFELPDPGDQATLFPERVQANLDVINEIEAKLITPNLKRVGAMRHELFTYQKGDLARVMCKPSMLVAWEQGLGKSCAGAVLIEAYQALGAENRALIVAPSDLIPQWRRELKKFTGREATVLPRKQTSKETGEQYAMNLLAEMRDLGKKLARGEADGIYLISYESLSLKGQSLSEQDDVHIHTARKVKKRVPRPRQRRPDGTWDSGADTYKGFAFEWSTETCPECGSSLHKSAKCHAIIGPKGKAVGHTHHGERGVKGHRCGWSSKLETPTIADLLAPGFKGGVVIVDEGTRIARMTSQRTQAVMKLQARHRLILTGTPIKNYVGQAFPLLLWCFGPKSPMFEYPWDGLTTWTDKFEVKERYQNPDDTSDWKYRTTGEITNLSELYLTLAVCSMRLTKEDTGERIVPIKTHVLEAPRGVKQVEQIVTWADTFGDFFRSKYPDHPLSQMGEARNLSAFLGLHKKWEWACSLPTGDPDCDWTGVDVSDWTPMMFKTLETTMKLLAGGRRVIVGTFHRQAGEFIASALSGKGANVACLVGATPAQRAAAIEAFQEGDTQVLVSTIRALNQGHNIDKANAVVCHGLDWAYDVHFQFIARAHRITSVKPVDVFVTLPGTEGQSVFGRIFRSLQDKAKGIASALDGVVEDLEFDRLSASDVTKQLLEAGVEADGTEVSETHVRKAWQDIPALSSYKRDLGFEATLASDADHDENAPLRRRSYVTPMVTHGDVATMLEGLWNRLRATQINGAVTIGDALDATVERHEDVLKAWMVLPEADRELIPEPRLSVAVMGEAVWEASGLKTLDPTEIEELEEEPVETADPEPVEPPETDQDDDEEPADVVVPDDLTAALMEQMKEMQEQMEALKKANEEMAERLASDEQLNLFGEAA